MSKFTVIFMPSIILGLFSLSTYSCSLACSTSSLSTSMFLLLLSDSLFVENCHELLLGNVIGNIVSLLYMGCQSTLFKVGFVTFVTFVLLFRLDIHLCNFYQLFSEKKLVPQSQIYVINGRLRALHMSKDTHLL